MTTNDRPTIDDDRRAGALLYTREADNRIAAALSEIASGDHARAARTLRDITARTAPYIRAEATARVAKFSN